MLWKILFEPKTTSPWAPYLFFIPIGAVQVIYGINGSGLSWSVIALLWLIGVLSWTPLEYFLHRFSFHSFSKSRWAKPFNSGLHAYHHDAPQALEYVAAPMRLALPVYFIYLGVAYSIAHAIAPESPALALMSGVGTGLVTGYLLYEWVHYSAHLRNPKSPVMRYLKKHHMLHHFKDKKNYFGVTSPAWDLVFGTKP